MPRIPLWATLKIEEEENDKEEEEVENDEEEEEEPGKLFLVPREAQRALMLQQCKHEEKEEKEEEKTKEDGEEDLGKRWVAKLFSALNEAWNLFS